jgi:hypothetical protein
MIAPLGSGPVTQGLVQDAVVARGVRNALIEHRDLNCIAIIVERLVVNICQQGSSGSDNIEERPNYHIDAAGHCANGANTCVDHDYTGSRDTQAHEVGSQ